MDNDLRVFDAILAVMACLFCVVMVPGVAKWQSLENFVWGAQVPAYKAAK
jgi:hypothetical protein